MMVFVVLGLFAYFAIAETYLSLVRRVKNHSFVHDLLLVRLVRGIRRFVHSVTKRGKGATIVALRYTAIFAVNILVLVFLAASEAFYDNFGIFLLVLVVLILFDLYHIFRIMKYATSVDEILKTTNRITEGELDAKVPVEKVSGNCLNLAESINSIGDGLNKAVEISTRDERMKAELITNVSHDIKTPLTSIINYVDLIKREHIEDEKVNSYIQVLDQKSQRLKQLIEDLVEASKASTGNIELECMNLNLVELLQQTIGEFDDKFISRNLRLVADIPSESCVIYADGRRSFRIIENLFQNAYKYAMPGTRIYLKLLERDGFAELTLKNISEAALNISPDELTERFVRGDSARTTEGSGLGLSIAKNLTELQGGSFEISIDGDLFRVVLTLPLAKNTGEADAAQNDSMQEA
jgi:signal transduction histidine kinase